MEKRPIKFYPSYESTTSFDAIDVTNPNTRFLLVWEIGKRCNYSCSYCGPTRHSNSTPHIDWDTLIKTADFVFEYLGIIMSHKLPQERHANIIFTGGEPTVNPNFIRLCEYVRNEYQTKYKHKYKLQLSVTTNGSFSRKIADGILQFADRATISYHTEAHTKPKRKAVDTIKYFHDKNFPLNVNVMMHSAPDNFQECLDVIDEIESYGVKYTPRIIGDSDTFKVEGDDGTHVYTPEQTQWFKDFWSKRNNIVRGCDSCEPESKQGDDKVARKLGRMCCGGKTINIQKDGGSLPTAFVDSTFFKGWYCSVNWYFLAIDQQMDWIATHQTCQARFDGTKGYLGSITESDKIITELKQQLESRTMPVIECPNRICNCGLCAPKAKSLDDFYRIMQGHVYGDVYLNKDDYEYF